MFHRGDIVSVDFPFTDGSGSKWRPAIILSNNLISASGDVVVVMITSHGRATDVIVELTPQLLSSPLPKDSFVKCHRLYALDASLVQTKFGTVNSEGMRLIFDKVVRIIS
jgi:mRNA interferase MazF